MIKVYTGFTQVYTRDFQKRYHNHSSYSYKIYRHTTSLFNYCSTDPILKCEIEKKNANDKHWQLCMEEKVDIAFYNNSNE